MNLNTTIKQNPATRFIVLTLGLSGALFLLPVTGEGALIALLFGLAAIPTIVAFALAMHSQGRQGAVALLRQSFHWRSPLHWYSIAFAVGFVIQFGSSVLALATGKIATIALTVPTPLLMILILWALLEEIGWRGFAPRRRWSALPCQRTHQFEWTTNLRRH